MDIDRREFLEQSSLAAGSMLVYFVGGRLMTASFTLLGVISFVLTVVYFVGVPFAAASQNYSQSAYPGSPASDGTRRMLLL